MNACDPSNIPQPNMTKMEKCLELGKTMTTEQKKCKGMSGAEACSCWTSDTMNMTQTELKMCNFTVSLAYYNSEKQFMYYI